MQMRTLIAAAAIGASSLVASGASAGGMARDLTSTEQLWSRLDDASVVGPAGKEIAEVKDMVIAEDGTIEQVILGRGGLFDIGEKLVAVSPQTLKPSMGEAGFVTAMTGEELKAAAPFHYGAEDGPMAEAGWMADRLVGAELHDDNGKALAEIKDLIITGNRVTFALLPESVLPQFTTTEDQYVPAPSTGAAGDAAAASTGPDKMKTGEERYPAEVAPGGILLALPFDELTIEQGSTEDRQMVMLKHGMDGFEQAQRIHVE